MDLGHFDKYFVKSTRKKAPQGNILEFFLLHTTKTTSWIENLTQRWTQSGPFFPKTSKPFSTFKKEHGRPPPLTDYVRALNMPDHLICLRGF